MNTKTKNSQPSQLYLLFEIAGDRFAVGIDKIRHILRFGDVSPVPGSSDNLVGVAEVRGETIPILDTGKLLGYDSSAPSTSRFIMLSQNIAGNQIGFVADTMCGNISINPSEQIITDGLIESGKYIMGTVNTENGIVVILDLEELAQKIEKVQL